MASLVYERENCGADGVVTFQKILRKSFHPVAPVEVTLAFSDQGPEYYKAILSPFTRPTQYWLPSEVKIKMTQRSYHRQPPPQRAIRLLEEIFNNNNNNNNNNNDNDIYYLYCAITELVAITELRHYRVGCPV